MINYTTPTISLVVEGVNISDSDVYVSIEQGKTELTKSGADLTITTETVQQVTNTLISFTLTQQESALFDYDRNADIQVNWIKNGVRGATRIETVHVLRNLLNEVIE